MGQLQGTCAQARGPLTALRTLGSILVPRLRHKEGLEIDRDVAKGMLTQVSVPKLLAPSSLRLLSKQLHCQGALWQCQQQVWTGVMLIYLSASTCQCCMESSLQSVPDDSIISTCCS